MEALNSFTALSISHQNFDFSEVGMFHIEPEKRGEQLRAIKKALELEELLYISTCNRVEFVMLRSDKLAAFDYTQLLQLLKPSLSFQEIGSLLAKLRVFEGKEAVNHMFEVASSLDSAVIGEREIITQVRNAFEESKEFDISGDSIRVLIRKTIEVAKKIYTETDISTKSVSVVALAFKSFMERFQGDISKTEVLSIGAGVTNTNLLRFFKKNDFKSFKVFNRSLAKAQGVVDEIGGEAYALSEIKKVASNPNVILACTSSSEPILNQDLAAHLKVDDHSYVIDLAIPAEVSPEVVKALGNRYIALDDVKLMADQNLADREKSIAACKAILNEAMLEFEEMFKTRQLERALNEVPSKVKEINKRAMEDVFTKELNAMSEQDRETVEKMMAYLEKKYISIPMRMAREILLNQKFSKSI